MNQSIKVGFLGAGKISDLHAEAVNAVPNIELKGLWNRTASKGEVKAKQFGCMTYASEEEMFNDPEIDAVFILTNVETHCDYTIRAARAGKHVLVEKPAANSIEELEKMKDVAAQTGIRCMPVHNYIYEPGIGRMREMIKSGNLGEITQFYMMYNIYHTEEIRDRVPGVVHEILTHNAYTLLYLLGKPQLVSCMKANIGSSYVEKENVAMAIMKLENNALSHFSASFAGDDHAGDPWTCMIKVMGTRGSARYSYRDWVINEPYGAHAQTYFAYPQSIKNTATHFVNNVLEKNQEPLSGLDDAIICQKIVEACDKSVEEGKSVVL